jgi:uncharacterized membrane protein YvbJ
MSFCPICGASHDPNFPCAERASEIMRDAGIKSNKMSEKELKQTIKQADRTMIILLVVVVIFVLIVLFAKFD